MENFFRLQGGALLLDIKAVPGASKSCLAGAMNGRIRVRIAKAPEDGKANAELASLLAGLLGCAKREISIVAGERSRLKTLALPASCLEKLEGLLREGEKKQ
jgi:uncharacterized protein (TIGR00251 family)